ncbi:MAG: two-component regulator propeller domain-containing protein, partial [Ignavibacteria bacterium]
MTTLNKIYSLFTLLFLCLTCASCSAQDKQSQTLPQFGRILLGEPATSLGNNIDCILHLKNGDYWIGTNGDGAYRYSQSILTHFTTKDGLVSDFVLGIQEDIHGRLWFTTRDGISQFDGLQFFTFTDSIKNAKIGPLNVQKGGIFFGLGRNNCYYDGKTFTSFAI